ncbi:MAG: GC-type dockerin domain-anchored protein [Phycisphaerales bacterium]
MMHAQLTARRSPLVRGVSLLLAIVGLCELAAGTARGQALEWNLLAATGPSPRAASAMACDSARGVTVLFGGVGGTLANPVLNSETWEWNGTAWTLRTNIGPSPRGDHAMAYDSLRGKTVLFGGYNDLTGIDNNETWEWDGTAWTQRMVSGPSRRGGHNMAYDTLRHVTVLFGGWINGGTANSGETWEWNGSAWTLRSIAGPSPRRAHEMAYDLINQVTVLFGGNLGNSQNIVPNGETWEWNGTAWTQRLVTGPSPRSGAAMAFDSALGRTVLFGGNLSNNQNVAPNGETWEWNAVGAGAWTQLMVSGPSPRAWHVMDYDTPRGMSVLFGGWNGTVGNGETWGLSVTCYANCDASTTAPALNIADFICFLNKFAAQAASANCDHSTTQPTLNIADFICFLNAFAAGCP